ncbi:DUF2852 domain-containing protein [Pseudoroseicyclus tamaricis]|uniref:DUF2852 domain-containing protein n=1 Tax=Pseudoroseicyclus tamaricis TaxID=2705421 RepID=A0A6B2JRQ2_9RHOB|nr:DUF2852 domain-containing protein [Pseudoroseicyclus tamaricis]NDV00868.1 DUF2852 domain-containing protein [Pseudoroseicyclus tamaricis]
MSSIDITPPRQSEGTHLSWFRKAEAWLDDKGKGAWIAVMVLGFVFFWPVGLAVLAYMIWSKRMFNKSCNRGRTSSMSAARAAMRPSGNSAFDAYKQDMLRRLEDEQRAFEEFLERLREAKDKSEFDQFMSDRARNGQSAQGQNQNQGQAYQPPQDGGYDQGSQGQNY